MSILMDTPDIITLLIFLNPILAHLKLKNFFIQKTDFINVVLMIMILLMQIFHIHIVRLSSIMNLRIKIAGRSGYVTKN